MFSASSRSRLTERDLERFPDDTLFHRVGRAVCRAGCLPRKELYEAWEMARRVRRHFRGGRVIDLGGGHGLLAQIMVLLDDSSPTALVVDKTLPPSSAKVHHALVEAWPRLSGRVAFVAAALEAVDILETDIVVSSHACGVLTDVVLTRAAAANARVAVLPCCHHLTAGNAEELAGWVDGALAIDIMRARRLSAAGYRIWTQTIPADITPKNRLLLGEPATAGRSILTHRPTRRIYAMTLTHLFRSQLEREAVRTRRALQNVPKGKDDWTPHAKSMPLLRLAGLVASMPSWIALIIKQDELELNPPAGQSQYQQPTVDGLVAALDNAVKDGLAALAGTTDDYLLSTNWKLLVKGNVVMDQPRHVVLVDTFNHLAHHRGQLTVYLRLNDRPVPAIYGPSADDQQFA